MDPITILLLIVLIVISFAVCTGVIGLIYMAVALFRKTEGKSGVWRACKVVGAWWRSVW
jgi:hypothetical protein